MKKIILTITLSCFITGHAQLGVDYLLEIPDGLNLGTISTTLNNNATVSISSNVSGFDSIINSHSIYSFEKAFGSTTGRLSRVYKINIDTAEALADIYSSQYVEAFSAMEDAMLLSDADEPFNVLYDSNDYDDPITGARNPTLDLIRAPLAWVITSGDPNILVGNSDINFKLDHYDFPENIGAFYSIGSSSDYHGTGTAGMIAAKTDNGVGISSIAHNSGVALAECAKNVYSLILGLETLVMTPGVKVVSCSWIVCAWMTSYKAYLDDVMDLAIANDVLVVGGAGNGNMGANCGGPGGNDYSYPASYDEAISVTSVASRYPIGYTHTLINPISGNYFWERGWADCHEFKPNTGEGTHTHNDMVNVAAPGILVTTITDRPQYTEGYRFGAGTSIATPIVAGLAGLIYSINPNFTAPQVKSIIESTTDDIYYIPYNQDFIGELGTGRINAFHAVMKAKCMTDPNFRTELDLAMQNTLDDRFAEPDNHVQPFWHSPDIWVRTKDELYDNGFLIKEHENPEYDPSDPNYVFVRITNNSCVTSSPQDEVHLYWSKANSSLGWPEHWDGTLYEQGVLMGDEIGYQSIPPLEPGASIVLQFPWYVPNPDDYIGINPNPWHFCLLARIVSEDDPMTFPEVNNLKQNIKSNNNIVMRNTTIVNVVPDSNDPVPVGGVVAVGNPFETAKSFDLVFSLDENEVGSLLYEEAEVAVTMDSTIYNAWNSTGKVLQNFSSSTGAVTTKIVVNGDDAVVENIPLLAGELGTIHVTFNFLTDELTGKRKYIYHLSQIDRSNGEVIGGETFEVIKEERTAFDADAGSDDEVNKNQSITLSASMIAEDAIYNWYDSDGNLIYTGSDMTITPAMTETYKLEVISTVDGFKDYDDVTVTVLPFSIQSLDPNPTGSLVNVTYDTYGAGSAYLMVIDLSSGVSINNYILDVIENSTTLDVSSYANGLYGIILIADGENMNSLTLVKQ